MQQVTSWAHRLLVALLFLAVPLLLLTANVWWAFTSQAFYLYGFDRFHVSDDTGISPEELRSVARSFTGYFTSPDEFLGVEVSIAGLRRPLFNDRELVHMRDVKGLVQGVALVRNISLGWLAAYVLVGFALGHRKFLPSLMRHLRAAALVAIGGLLIAGTLVVVAFPALFRLFHLISFQNPFWLLDPATDYLVRLFPSQFFFEATIFIALATLGEALLLAAMAWWWIRVAGPQVASPGAAHRT